MMRSLFAGVSALRNHQVRMDVIGNNIANVNTVAFKSSRVTFNEAFAQLVQGGTNPPGADTVTGGTNPVQVGLGMRVGSIDMIFNQGNLETTGVTTDLAIQGNSFFVVSNGEQNFFTRSGNFQIDGNGRLVAGNNVVQGRMATNGVLSDVLTDVRLPFGQKSPAKATENVTIGGNLRADAPVGTTRQSSLTIYDEQGNPRHMNITFTKSANNTWDYGIEVMDPADTADPPVPLATDAGVLTFNADGSLEAPDDATVALNGVDITVDFGTVDGIDGISQYASANTAVLRDQDGYTMGLLERISIDATGEIKGAFSNGVTLTLAQVAVADFNNPGGLIRLGDNVYTTSPNSGQPVYGFAGGDSQSLITSGALEMSNVDLAQEFTSMIIAQRGFQSNARVISASDEMLQELVNLKR